MGVVGEKVKSATIEAADTVIVFEVVADCPTSLVTVSVTVNVAALEYGWVGVTPEPLDPSPKSQEKAPLVTVDDEALKNTVSPALGVVGENVKLATTCVDVAETTTGLDVVADCPAPLVTVRVTVYVPALEY